jgi:LmbE family N-acetylglucosaminyl deacetylase
METKRKNILSVGAHPDDVEFMCSGTLKLLKDKGFKIHICIVANGDLVSSVENQENITKIRRKEAVNAASRLEAELYPLGELDLRIALDERTKMKVTEIIRMVDPLIVFTHAHEDYVMDHEITSRLTRHGCFSASIPNYFTQSVLPQPRTPNAPYLYYWSPLEGKNIYGDFVEQRIYVDITEVIDFKAEMLGCHKSQKDWMSELGMDKYIAGMKETARRYGKVSGFDYAEGFTQHVGTGLPQDNILKEILGDVMKEQG